MLHQFNLLQATFRGVILLTKKAKAVSPLPPEPGAVNILDAFHALAHADALQLGACLFEMASNIDKLADLFDPKDQQAQCPSLVINTPQSEPKPIEVPPIDPLDLPWTRARSGSTPSSPGFFPARNSEVHSAQVVMYKQGPSRCFKCAGSNGLLGLR